MIRKTLAILGALVFALGIGLAAADSAQAVTWTNRPLVTHSTYVDDCSTFGADIVTTMQWQTSSEWPGTRGRPNGAVDLTIKNQTDLTGIIWDYDILYLRLVGNDVVSSYHYGTPPALVYIYPGETKTFSLDNPDRWTRRDGVSDSDPSPTGSPVLLSNNPAISIHMALGHAGGCSAGDGTHDYDFNDEIAWDATR